MIRMSIGEKIFQIFAVSIITLMCITMLFPFIHLLSVSFSSPAEATRPGIHLIPKDISFEAYKKTLQSTRMWIGFGNSVFRTVIGAAAALFMMAITAYPLSKKYLPHRPFYNLIIIMTLFFSGGLIPSYLLIKNIGLMDSYLVYIVPMLIATFSLLIMRNFFMGIPAELEDSAKIDGANDFRILMSIVLPLSKPILATIGLWQAVNHWNAWFDALMYIQTPSKMVLQLYLRRLIISNEHSELNAIMSQDVGVQEVIPETIKAAVLIVVTVPIVLVYPFLQKYFVKGALIGSLKG